MTQLNPPAPPERKPKALSGADFDRRVAALEEALAEGISVSHPAMPEFQFAAADVDALIAYLEPVQE